MSQRVQTSLQQRKVEMVSFDWWIEDYLEKLKADICSPEFCIKNHQLCLHWYQSNGKNRIQLQILDPLDSISISFLLSVVDKNGAEESIKTSYSKFEGVLNKNVLKSPRFIINGQLRVRCRVEAELQENDKPVPHSLPFSDFTLVNI